MRIDSKLCHISENKAVVQVIGWHNDKNLGSALAEGPTVEVAEDNAISRLKKRLKSVTNNDTYISSINEEITKSTLKVQLPNSNKIEKSNVNHEPSDWSNELTAIDLEIQRLNWSRDDEISFLEKKLGYNNRNKITNYSDIVNYLNLLKNENQQKQHKGFEVNINSLIDESDMILRDLSWDNIQGREYLQKEFNVSTRKELNEKQLISFVEKLKSIRSQYLPH
ncbi:hypothetical protein [Prochlorococcus marinus]|uniref:hypothetical protein n=1 Tax=Prochlorococcus marinus TaxID=1219 RepID=UPI0022B3F19D|nr:hypothetical protein [Prochlorococcus marinus]